MEDLEERVINRKAILWQNVCLVLTIINVTNMFLLISIKTSFLVNMIIVCFWIVYFISYRLAFHKKHREEIVWVDKDSPIEESWGSILVGYYLEWKSRRK